MAQSVNVANAVNLNDDPRCGMVAVALTDPAGPGLNLDSIVTVVELIAGAMLV